LYSGYKFNRVTKRFSRQINEMFAAVYKNTLQTNKTHHDTCVAATEAPLQTAVSVQLYSVREKVK